MKCSGYLPGAESYKGTGHQTPRLLQVDPLSLYLFYIILYFYIYIQIHFIFIFMLYFTIVYFCITLYFLYYKILT